MRAQLVVECIEVLAVDDVDDHAAGDAGERVRPKMTHRALPNRLREIDGRLSCDWRVVKMGRTRKTGIRTASFTRCQESQLSGGLSFFRARRPIFTTRESQRRRPPISRRRFGKARWVILGRRARKTRALRETSSARATMLRDANLGGRESSHEVCDFCRHVDRMHELILQHGCKWVCPLSCRRF
jgi:hypothetical protein